MVRNLALIGPAGVGKTTLAEALLFDMAMIPHRGRVEEGTTVMDTDSEEILRQHSVATGIATGEWKGCAVTLLDTPGLSDFQAETRWALTAADGAVLVISATRGVDANAVRLYRMTRERKLPVILFVNGVEAEGALDYSTLLDQIRERLDSHAIPLELPVGRADVDLIGMRTWHFNPETGDISEVSEPPSDLRELVDRYHAQLVEAVAERDDTLLERYLGGSEPNESEIRSTLKAAMRQGDILPVMCGSARENLAIRPLLDAILELMPSPEEAPTPELSDPNGEQRTIPSDSAEPFSAQVFKTFSDPYQGKVSVFRVRSGSIQSDSHASNPNQASTERIGRLFRLVGKQHVPVDRLVAGEIGAVAKLKDTHTGDTLSNQLGSWHYPMPAMPQSIFAVAIAPKAKGDEAKLAISLAKLKEEDPALEVGLETRTHRTILRGLGQTHLDVALSRLENRYNIEVSRSEPQVPYRETVRSTASGQGKHKKQTGGRGQYGDVWLRIDPLPRGSGFQFGDEVVGGAVPRNFIPAVEKGIREMLEQGILAGCPIVDVKVTLYDGSSHSVDSSEQAFKTAAHLALKKIFMEAQPTLLEPILDVTTTVPEAAVGDLMSDLNSRRAQIEGMEGGSVHVKMPLAELPGFIQSLQGLAKGQGSVETHFSHYQEVPSHLQPKILATMSSEAQAAT